METNTKINIPPPSVQKDEITISGEKEGVAIAKDKILQIYKEKVDTMFINVQDFTVQLYFCDLSLKYRTINLLWDIWMMVFVRICQCIQCVMNSFFKERRVTTVSIEVKKSQHKYVIGPKGHVLQEILATTGGLSDIIQAKL